MKEEWKIMLRSFWKRLRFRLGILHIDSVKLPDKEKESEQKNTKKKDV